MSLVTADLARKWLAEAIAASKLTPTEIARRARLTPSALTRPLSPKHKGKMKVSTLRKVAEVTAHPLPKELGANSGSSAAPVEPADAVEIAVLLADAIPTGRAISAEEKSDLIRKTLARMKARRLVS
jgi:hypothetical protein